MKVFSIESTLIVTVLTIASVSCESYERGCFISYLLKNDLIDKSYEIFSSYKKEDKCTIEINAAKAKFKRSTPNQCTLDFLKKKSISDTLLKEYLIPQIKSKQEKLHFDNRFEVFKNKTFQVANVICNNREIFRPDMKGMMKQGRLQKEAKSKELECLQNYILVKNKPLSDECKKVVDSIQKEFYYKMEINTKKAFLHPNEKLIDFKCGTEKAKNSKLFEKIFFFVVLAANKNLNDKQIDSLLKNAEGVIVGNNKLIFECMN